MPDKRCVRMDGKVISARVSRTLIRGAAGAAQIMISQAEDTTEPRSASPALARASGFARFEPAVRKDHTAAEVPSRTSGTARDLEIAAEINLRERRRAPFSSSQPSNGLRPRHHWRGRRPSSV
jgi:hypothetical protein